jgi:hypothetical protein
LENEGKGLESCVEDKAPGTMSIHLQRYVHDWLPSGLQAATLVFFCVRIESIDHAMLLTQFGGSQPVYLFTTTEEGPFFQQVLAL